MSDPDRLIEPADAGGDDAADRSLRPRTLDQFVGQQPVRDQLAIFLQAARARSEALEHVLLAGPPGLGKSTLAHIVANEMEGRLVTISGPALDKKGDLVAILTDLGERDVLFIDEVHRLSATVEETLYPAMEDGVIDIMMGQGPGARSLRLTLQPFTLVGATTRASMLTKPLRDRFGIPLRLEHYDDDDLARIVRRSAGILEIALDDAAAVRSRGARAAHRGSPTACSGARATTPRCEPAAISRARLRRAPSTCWASTPRGSTASTASSCARSPRPSWAAPSASRPSRTRLARTRARSRTSTSRTCCSAASCNERRAGA